MPFFCSVSCLGLGFAYQQDTSREGAKGAAPTTGTAAAVKAEEPGADANKNASILSAYHPLLAKRTTSNSAAQIDVSWK